MKKRSEFSLLAGMLVLGILSGPSAGFSQESLRTLSVRSLASTEENAKSSMKVGETYFVTANRLNLRISTSLESSSIRGYLSLGDEVEVLDLLDGSSSMVKIKIIKSMSADSGKEMYVSADYLSQEAPQKQADKPSKYIVIQNVASERMRVYERCTTSADCPHRLVMETEMVVGRPEGPKEDPDRYLTWLGRYKITAWVKYYEDGAKHYPSWYDPNYPALPKPGSSPRKWLSKKLLPDKENGSLRGAFGWYAAMVGPDANYQWIHGTFGWGSDENTFIEYTRGFFVNMFADPRSSGCTRLENRAVAYSRHILGVGTEVVRVYAKEAYADPSRQSYEDRTAPWEFILTKQGVRKYGAATIDKNFVLSKNTPESEFLEKGKYDIDQHPDLIPFTPSASKQQRNKGDSGNSYGVDDSKLQGYFLVDEGRFVNYQHPKGMGVGGFKESSLPEYLVSDKTPHAAESSRRGRNSR